MFDDASRFWPMEACKHKNFGQQGSRSDNCTFANFHRGRRLTRETATAYSLRKAPV